MLVAEDDLDAALPIDSFSNEVVNAEASASKCSEVRCRGKWSGSEDVRYRLAAAEENGLSQGRTPGDCKVQSGFINGSPTKCESTGRSMGTSRGVKSSSNQFSR